MIPEAFTLAREEAPPEVIAHFTVDGEPASKARARFTNYGSKVHTYTPAKTKAAEAMVGISFRRAAPGYHPDPNTAYGLAVVFINGTRQRRDVDNMVKLVCDGLNGIAWVDDAQVVELSGKKRMTASGDPRTEVIIYSLGAMEHPTKDCAHCGEPFKVYASTAATKKFCGNDCMYAHRREQNRRTCQNCGKDFQRKLGRDGAAPKYCTTTCATKHRTVAVQCKTCGTTFRTPQSWADKEAHYCSADCRDATPNCKHGHPWAEHTGYRAGGRRYCKECNRAAARNYKARITPTKEKP